MSGSKAVQKEVEDLIRQCVAQGFEVRHTKSGVVILGKDGTSTVMFHLTYSDWRWRRNKLAELRRIGFVATGDENRKGKRGAAES